MGLLLGPRAMPCPDCLVANTMTRDEEIRQDLERQWRKTHVEKTGSDLGKAAQNLQKFAPSSTHVARRTTAQDWQHSSDSDDGHLYRGPEAVDLRIQSPNQRSRHWGAQVEFGHQYIGLLLGAPCPLRLVTLLVAIGESIHHECSGI